MNTTTRDIRVMTSGAFTAALIELIPALERLTRQNIVLAFHFHWNRRELHPKPPHITPLPPELQKVSVFSAGVAASTSDFDLASSVIKVLSSPGAARAITKSGLEPIGN